MPTLPADLLVYIVLGLTCLILTLLYTREYNRARGKGLDAAQTKSYQILSQAIKKAQVLMSASELEALKLSADSKFYKDKLEQKFSVEIDKAIQEYLTTFKNYSASIQQELTKSQTEYSSYIAYLKEQTDKSRNESLDSIRELVSNMFSRFEEKLTQFLGETQKNSLQSIELELKATRQLIETYKSNQLKIIDENVISMLERTLSLVLVKKLTLKDQIDLVYESLEQAKSEKFIV